MTQRHRLRTFLTAVALLATAGAALAQSEMCQRYRAELASLGQGGGPQAAAAERQRVEIARLTGYFRQIGCERGALDLFGGPAPPDCGSISQRIRQLQASYAALASQAGERGQLDVRRRQLMAAIDQTCTAEQAPRGFFESLFGAPRGRVAPPSVTEEMPHDNVPGIMPEGDRPLGGGRLVCVRTCDGFFFPLSTSPNGRQSADEMCQALCPGTETAAFSMSGSDDALTRAVSLKGRPYSTLANAFRFQKAFDDSCACKTEGQSWAQILRRAEGMLDQRRGDIIVTAQKAEEMSRPKVTPPPAPPTPAQTQAQAQARKAAEKKASEAAESQEAAEQGASAPTASKESSGIGPQSIETSKVVGTQEGPKQEIPAGNGAKRTIRVIAPNIIPVPNAAKGQ